MRFEAVFKGILTLLGIAAIGLVAAILDSPIDFSSDGGGAMTSGRSGPSDAIVMPEIPLAVQLLVLVVGMLLAGLCVLYLIENPMQNLLVVVGICLGVAVVLAVLVSLSSIFGGGTVEPVEDSEPAASAISEAVDSSDGSVQATTYVVILLGGWFLIFMLILLYLRSRASPSTEATADDQSGLDGDTPAAVGAAAGRAATQIENAPNRDLENEIYRAWHEMTAQLPVDAPQSTTPREFEAAAVDAGLERGDVSKLTDLFESVRYGTLETTSAREDHAVATLRRIESAYGTDESGEVTS